MRADISTFQPRQRLDLYLADTAIYAIGDVHGCLDELVALEHKIAADAQQFSCRKLIIMLGDYVDHGPESKRVLNHLLGPPMLGFERVCLLGNHEQAMLDYLDGRLSLSDWLELGAAATLNSYGIDPEQLFELYQSQEKVDAVIRQQVPDEHVRLLRGLPIIASSRNVIFVHAGLRPGIAEENQADVDLITIGSTFLDAPRPFEKWIVHGHAPVSEPQSSAHRLNLDTGAYQTGVLSAVRLGGGEGIIITNK